MKYSSEMVNLITKLKLIELKINYLNKHEKKLNSKIIRINKKYKIYENKLKCLKNFIF